MSYVHENEYILLFSLFLLSLYFFISFIFDYLFIMYLFNNKKLLAFFLYFIRAILASCDKSISRFSRSIPTAILPIDRLRANTVPKLSSSYYDKRSSNSVHNLTTTDK
jgi:hypothetical protein